ncbi:hypothetical protein ATB98_22560 [Sinorhizobium saheli]|uniref:Uncharacterized protein n=1 Tax=Sinorhizobium saheli TaxID=36856 RepID=A0A178YSK9_SINSA|nr:hypothetical protein ATB98_22560 [Sinorhizobium saheli]
MPENAATKAATYTTPWDMIPATARQLLSTFEEALVWHIADRDRLIREKMHASRCGARSIAASDWNPAVLIEC